MQMFLLLFCVYGDYCNSKQKTKQYTEMGATLLGWPKSIYYIITKNGASVKPDSSVAPR